METAAKGHAMMDNSTCPVCTETLDPRKGVVSTSHGWMHPTCEQKYTAAKAKLSDSIAKQAAVHRAAAGSPDNEEYETASDVVVLERPVGRVIESTDPTVVSMRATVAGMLLQVLPPGVEHTPEVEAWAKDRAGQHHHRNHHGVRRRLQGSRCGAAPPARRHHQAAADHGLRDRAASARMHVPPLLLTTTNNQTETIQ